MSITFLHVHNVFKLRFTVRRNGHDGHGIAGEHHAVGHQFAAQNPAHNLQPFG